MPKAAHSVSSAPPNSKRRSRKYASTDSDLITAASLKDLKNIRQAEVTKYNTVKNTKSAYDGHRSRGRIFLHDLVAKRRVEEAGSGIGLSNDGIPNDELACAFDNGPPNQYSALALEMFLVHKCFTQGCGKNTAEGVHGAFAELWDKFGNGEYSGQYCLNEKTGEVKGCPARAPDVKAVMQSIKTRDKSKGASATRNHAEAMSIDEIKHLMCWSTHECPDEMLDAPSQGKLVEFVDQLKNRMEHGFMCAFLSSGFTLWTRCFELLSLQVKDITEGCIGPAPHYAPYVQVELLDCKGWQHEKGYDGPRQSNIYNIYKQDIPAIDMHTHLLRWIRFLEGTLGRKLEGDNYLFPHIRTNGVLRTDKPMSYDCLQSMLTDFCKRAGTEKRYTTHSLRRGGAQYRFMYAPIGKRWSLNRVRWWGGWAVGEHVDTLIKYLVDSLQSFENGHSDALAPDPVDPSNFFMGDHTAVVPATNAAIYELKAEVRDLGSAMSQNMKVLACTYMQTAAPAAGPKTTVQPPQPPSSTSTSTTSLYNTPMSSAASFVPTLVPPIAPAPESESHQRRAVPIPNVSIPSIGRHSGAWQRALGQWYQIDPQTGYALKDWPSSWYRGGNMGKAFGSLYSQRELLALEFERLGSSYERFLLVYPNADKSIAKLLDAIRANTDRERRSSKNGTPELREARAKVGTPLVLGPSSVQNYGRW